MRTLDSKSLFELKKMYTFDKNSKLPLIVLVIVIVLFGAAGVKLLNSSNAEAGFGPETGRPFLADDAFTRPLPTNPVIDPNSSAMVTNLVKNTGAAIYDYGVPVYHATASTPRKAVNCTENWGTCDLEAGGVPLDSSMQPSNGTDGAMIVIDFAAGKSYEFWRYNWNNGNPTTSWGSVENINGSGSRPQAPTGAGISRLAGLVRTWEIRKGAIEHPLVFSTNVCQTTTYRYPASKTDGKYSGAGAIPEGTKFQLDPSINVDASSMNQFEKIVAKALQKYGAYAMDCGGASAAFIFETPYGEADPYGPLGIGDYNGMRGIPWNRMRALAHWHGGSSLGTKPPISGTNPTPTPTPPTPTPTPPTPTPPTGSSVDLTVTNVTASPAAPIVGNAVTFSATVRNQGTTATPSGVTVGAGFWVNGTQVLWGSVPSIAAGATATITSQFNMSDIASSWTAVNGAHTIEAFVDDAGRIAESNETNNKRTLSLTVGTSTPPPPPPVDTAKPNVSLTAPAANTSAAVGATVNLAAAASDNVGVTKVEFYNGATLLGTDTSSPYSFAWNSTGQTAGSKSLTAKAYDAAGNNQTSAVVTINLTGPNTSTPGDANGDGKVNALDLSVLITNDGKNYQPADFNGDGTVGAADMAILLSRWTW